MGDVVDRLQEYYALSSVANHSVLLQHGGVVRVKGGRVYCFHSWLAHNPLLEPLPAPLLPAPNCAAWCALAESIQLRTAWIMTTRITSRTMSLLRLLLESRSRCARFNWSRVSWILPSRSSMERVWSRTGFSAVSRR